jgi:hypothetical protein
MAVTEEQVQSGNGIEKMDKYNFMEQLRAKLLVDRSPYETHWKDIQQILDPHLVIWDMSTTGFPNFAQDILLSSKPLQAFDELVAGLQEGITPAYQEWIRYQLTDEEGPLADDEDVWEYLHLITKKAQTTLLGTNFYQQTPTLYRSVSRFMTGAIMMEKDPETRVRFTTFPIGSYYCSNNNRGIADTFCRMFQMTTRQIIEQFCTAPDGTITFDNVSQLVKDNWESSAGSKREEKINVIHMIYPNKEYHPESARYNRKFKRYSANYYEWQQNVDHKLLKEEGYDYFPVYVVRWWRQFTDSYGVDGPGFKAIGDIRQLYQTIEMYLNSMAKVLEPPLAADPSIAGVVGGQVGTVPGFMTIVPGGVKGGNFGAAYQIAPDLTAIKAAIDDLKQDIDRICMADIFRMLANDERQTPPTATEVLQRIQENNHVLGPIFGNFNFEWLEPMMRDLYWIMLDDGDIPPAPPQMHGSPLKVEVVSRVAIALKMGEITGYQKGIEFATAIAAAKAQGDDSINADEFMPKAWKILNLPPQTLYSLKQKQVMRQQKAQQQAQEQQVEAAHKLSGAAKNLGGADTGDGNNMLQQLLEGLKSQAGAQ